MNHRASASGVALFVALSTVGCGAHAQALYDFDLPAQPLARSLTEIGSRTGVNVVFRPEAVRSKTAPALKGEFGAHAALDRIIAGSGLALRMVSGGSYLIEAPQGLPAGAAPSAGAAVQQETREESDTGIHSQAALDSALIVARAGTVAKTTVDELTIIGQVPELTSSIDKKSYALGKDLQAQTGSIADALRNVPAVEVDLQGNLSVRGDQNVTILVDGKPSPAFEGAARASALQNLPADQIERVEVMTNPSAALNPEGTGGVINLITKRSRGGGWTGSAYATASSAALKRGGLNLGYNSGILAVTAAFSGNYQRYKQHNFNERDGLDEASGAFLKTFDQYLVRELIRGSTARITANLTPNDKDQLTAEVGYSVLDTHGHPDNLFTDLAPDGASAAIFDVAGRSRFYEGALSASGGWKHSFGESESLSVDGLYNATNDRHQTLDATRYVLPAGRHAPLELFRDDADAQHAELRTAYVRNLAGGEFKTGYEARREDNDAPYTVSIGADEAGLVRQASQDNHYRFHQTVQAIYATYLHAFAGLDVQAGLRLEDARLELDQRTSGARGGQHYEGAYPTLHLAYRLDDARKLSASYTVRIQRPSGVMLDPLAFSDGLQSLLVGNPALKPRETRSFELGYEQRAGSQSLQATVYYRVVKDDFTQLISHDGAGVFLYRYANLGRGQQVGVDLSAAGKLSSTLTYNLSLSPYWNEIDTRDAASSLGRRSLVSASGRAILNWQADPADVLQLNIQVSGARVQPLGVVAPANTLNAGWRHALGDRVAVTITGQDLLATSRYRRDLIAPALIEHVRGIYVSRTVLLRLDYRFGGGAPKPKAPDFDYGDEVRR